MVLWITLALLTAAVAAALLSPFLRGGPAAIADHAGDVEVYRDQLKEIERDCEQGLIDAEQAQYARAEVGRRLLAAAALDEGKAQAGTARGKHRLVTAFVTLMPPAVGLCLYIALGSPGLPDQPLAVRLANPGNNMALLVAKAERHLAENPADGAGWDLLGPIYLRLNRAGDAGLAFRNAIRILGPNAARLSGLGESLVAQSDGIVTEDARAAFEQSVRLDPENPRPRFYVALGLEQAGKAAEAKAAFEQIAEGSPADAPWMPLLDEHIVKNGGQPMASAAAAPVPAAAKPPGGPTQADVAAAQDLSQGDRQAMIRGMVDSLSARLKEQPDNLEGWLRLVRSYAVLGDRENAVNALKSALVQFPADSEPGKRLVALGGEIGLSNPAPAGDNAAEGARQ